MPVNQLWKLEGVLTTLSPLHVGDGQTQSAESLRPRCGLQGDIATVFRDTNDLIYLPGSSLRGFLRDAFGRRFGESSKDVKSLFGFQEERPAGGPADACGGLLGVWDALLDTERPIPADPGEYWEKNRRTCIASHVVLDRRTRTADEGLLFFEEFVPAGVNFKVAMTLECAAQRDGEDLQALVRKLLRVLAELRDGTGRLGANTARGYGHVGWSDSKVSTLTDKAFKSWLSTGKQLVDCLEKIPVSPEPSTPREANRLRIPVTVRFSGPLLVNDTSRAKPKGQGKQKDDGRPNHAAMRTSDGTCRLPASALHGALRAHTERIARTIAADRAKEWVRDVARPSGEAAEHTAVDYLWGGIGLRAPIRLSDFESKQPGGIARQQFIAIDRFTGGGVDGLKFNAEGFVKPVLHGEISIDIPALRSMMKRREADNADPPRVREDSGPEPSNWREVWRLLAFCIRDWMEGDIYLGFGASKGYGHCQAELTGFPDARQLFSKLCEVIEEVKS